MPRPTLTICTGCDGGEALYERVRKLRKARDLKDVFKVDETRCLNLCSWPCNAQLEGKKRSTYVRSELDPKRDVEGLVQAACDYAALAPGQELSERQLPGSSLE